MRYKCHVTQLPFTNFHTDSLCFVFLFYFQGDIATCAGTYLYVWSVNGQLIVKENTSLQNTNHIQCCAMSEVRQTTCNRQRATTFLKARPDYFIFLFFTLFVGLENCTSTTFPGSIRRSSAHALCNSIFLHYSGAVANS